MFVKRANDHFNQFLNPHKKFSMKPITQIVLIVVAVFYFSACSKEEPTAVSNYRDALIGTYTGLQTQNYMTINNRTDTSYSNYTDSIVIHEIKSSVSDENALLFGNWELCKVLESTDYYLFYDSTVAYSTNENGSNRTGGTYINKIEFFTNKDSIVIYSDVTGGSWEPGSMSYETASTFIFNGVKDN